MTGERTLVLEHDGTKVMVMDSVSFATAQDAGAVIVTGSHGGASAGEYALRCACRCLVANDAGFGRNDAGIRGLVALDEAGVAGIAVAHTSARIGDGADTWASGIVSFANDTARRHGVGLGLPLRDAVRALVAAEASRC